MRRHFAAMNEKTPDAGYGSLNTGSLKLVHRQPEFKSELANDWLTGFNTTNVGVQSKPDRWLLSSLEVFAEKSDGAVAQQNLATTGVNAAGAWPVVVQPEAGEVGWWVSIRRGFPPVTGRLTVWSQPNASSSLADTSKSR